MRETDSILFMSGLLLLVSFIVVSGCFITNCPPGGKRSGTTNLKIRQCEQCGPPGMKGRCYGPQICCSPEFGCLMGTSETRSCLQENHHTTLCHNPGDPCGGNDESNLINGQCGATGLCCSTETCIFDNNCQYGPGQGLKNTNKISHGEEQQILKPQTAPTLGENSIQMFPNPMERLFYRRVNQHKGIHLDKLHETEPSEVQPQQRPFIERISSPFNENIILNANDY